MLRSLKERKRTECSLRKRTRCPTLQCIHFQNSQIVLDHSILLGTECTVKKSVTAGSCIMYYSPTHHVHFYCMPMFPLLCMKFIPQPLFLFMSWHTTAEQGGVIRYSTFLLFSKSDRFLPITYIFRSSIPKNQQLRPCPRVTRAAKFSF